jgi:nucleotide-binding universal stress UspA family protein
MKILVALDAKDYSKKIIKDVARLARNTLADLTLLGVQDKHTDPPSQGLVKTLLKYRDDICSYFDAEDMLYGDLSSEEFDRGNNKDWILKTKGRKECTLRISAGSVARQTVAVAAEIQADLIILGCSGKLGCEWDGEMNVPLRVAKDAPCAVLVIKQPKNANQIVSILDHSIVSQDSLELINQMVTLHDAGLKIVGVHEKKGGNKQDQLMETRMVELLKYYNEKEIGAWVKLIDSQDLKEYVTLSSRDSIVALWMGKESLIKKLFSISTVDKLLETTRSSLLILR